MRSMAFCDEISDVEEYLTDPLLCDVYYYMQMTECDTIQYFGYFCWSSQLSSLCFQNSKIHYYKNTSRITSLLTAGSASCLKVNWCAKNLAAKYIAGCAMPYT